MSTKAAGSRRWPGSRRASPGRFASPWRGSRPPRAGALHQARDALHERFLLCDARRLLAGNLARLLADAARDNDDVIGRRVLHAPSGRETGIACFGPRLRALLTPACSLEGDILPTLRATAIEGCFRDLRDANATGTQLAAELARPALFLDRDGVINRDHGWVGTRERFEWMPGIETAIREACDAGWHVFVVTNQSGVARGLYGEAEVRALHAWMADHLRRAGGTIDDVRFCPTHPEAALPEYRRVSDWRKPGPGMILDLMRCWELDPARCILVGDQPTDLAAAAAAGIAARLFGGGDVVDCLAAARAAIRP